MTDFYRSMFTGRLCLTVASPVLDHTDEITSLLGADLRFEELVKLHDELKHEHTEDYELERAPVLTLTTLVATK